MEAIGMEVGKSILSAVISKLVNTTADSDFLNYAYKQNVDAEIKKWNKTLIKINAVLSDAEKKRTDAENSEAVKEWLRDLKDLVYEVEDVLDEVKYEALRCKFTANSQGASSSTMRALIPSCCTSFSLSNAKFGSKLKELTTKFEKIVKDKNDLGLIDKSNVKFEKRSESTPLYDQSCVYGRDAEKEKIIQLLLGGETSSQLSVISISGMGGLGKTFLAKLVYNDEKVKTHFDSRAWVCVSDVFDIFKITKAIWQSVTENETCNFETLALLHEKLKEKLSTKKFFIVLDDVWNENADEWDTLCHPFRTSVAGCTLLVTTRNKSVVSKIRATSEHPLEPLSIDESVSLLASYAFGNETKLDGFPDLKNVGTKIVEKCGRLPLAVKTLAGVLRNNTKLHDWETVLSNDMWDSKEAQEKILPALKLSYHYLPAALKCCFVYCSLFPKDYEFEKSELVSLWMAEGFLSQHNGKKEIEDLGCDYFDKLLSRSFFQQSSINDERYVMHDLINDLARFVAKEEKIYLWLDGEMDVCEAYDKDENVRHLSFVSSRYDILKRFKNISELKQLRTFLALYTGIKKEFFNTHCLSYDVLHTILPEFKCLKVLSLYKYAISELPNNIGVLKLLRHLDLSWSHITRLPNSVAALYNLQTLILYQCSDLVELPKNIINLVELQKLDLAYTKSLLEMPSGICSLTKLKTLSKFIVSKGDKHQIRELQELTRLRGKLSIYGLDNVQDIKDVTRANLKGKEGLDDINLIWSNEFYDSRNVELEMQVLDSLEPNKNLKVLQIKSYGGNDFPSWIGNPCFANMESITLLECKKSKCFPSLGGLPLLNYLHIEGNDGVESVGREFSGRSKSFPMLDTLKFDNMVNWVDWSCFDDAEEFPRLRKLRINNCRSLKGNLPCQLPSLVELEINNCPSLKGNLPCQLPSLVKLEIYGCPLLVGSRISLPSLVEMRIHNCNVSVVRSMVDLNSITILSMTSVLGFSYLDEELMKSLTKVIDLTIYNCEELTCLWKNDEVANERSEEVVQTPRGLNLLKRLSIRRCKALETLPDWWTQKNSGNHQQCLLEELSIKNCSLIKSLSRSNLPTTLKKLHIEWCDNLECLPDELMGIRGGCCHLEELSISDCPSLTSFPPGKFPVTLQSLSLSTNNKQFLSSEVEERLSETIKLQEITVKHTNIVGLGLGLSCFKHLTNLWLCDCDDIVSFPDNVFLVSTPNLRDLSLSDCKNLKSLPREMHKLLSLQSLELFNCPCIIEFPEGGLPPNLIKLNVSDCSKLKQPISEWGLNTLTSLKDLFLNGPIGSIDEEIVSFPDMKDGICILPSSLTQIIISNFKNMESISSNLQSLTSLQELIFGNCPKLKSLPKEGLPDSLGRLEIFDCPIVGERCIKEERGEYWSCISHIPVIQINHQFKQIVYTGGCRSHDRWIYDLS